MNNWDLKIGLLTALTPSEVRKTLGVTKSKVMYVTTPISKVVIDTLQRMGITVIIRK